ncbi:MAG: TetR/AcrR family transcriptional regulator [Lentisphaeria bacterium]|nr:TetR/AcrR family transcriptional regulator [Lentisphaeria bacterium]
MTKRQSAALETKRKLIDAARKIVSERGLAGTQVEEITRLCGVSKGTFYTYFKRKEDVIFSLCKNRFGEIKEAALASHEPFSVRLSSYMVDFCSYIEKESLKLCQEWIRDTADPDFAGNQDGINKLKFDIESVAELINDGINRGELKPDTPVEPLAHTLVEIMYGEMLCWATSNGAFSFSERSQEFCEQFLTSLLKPYLTTTSRRKNS